MATLEVHDSRGRVEYVTIAPNSQALIGSAPNCDVVLRDPNVLPIHGRLRWKRGKLKVEATPDSHSLEVNGRKIVSGTLHQGDEVRIGGYRIFLLNLGEAAPETERTIVQAPPRVGDAQASPPRDRPAARERPAAARERPPAPPKDDRTLVKPPPVVGGAQGASTRSGSRARNTAADLDIVAPPSFAFDSVIEALPTVARPPEVLPRGRSRRSERKRDPNEAPKESAWWRRPFRLLAGRDRAPGDEDVLSSPLVLSLLGALVVLIGVSALLWRTVSRRAADYQFQAAIETFQDGDHLNAIQRFERFLEAYPSDSRAARVRVLKSLAGVRQFTGGGSPAWKEGLDAARTMAQEHAEAGTAFEDSRADLAEEVLKIAEGLSDRARLASDPAVLADAESAAAFHEELLGESAAGAQARSRLPGKLAAARAAVHKGLARREALATMDKALTDRSAGKLYEARDRLVLIYPDLADDPAVVQRLTQANELLREAVRFDPSVQPADLGPRPEPLGPPLSLVLRTAPKGVGPGDGSEGMVFALAEGFAYGLDAGQGKPLWHHPVGTASPFPPVLVAGSPPSALVIDAREQTLLRVEARTGRVLWRQSLEGPTEATPLVLGNDIYQAMPDGRLLLLDLVTGERRGTIHCGKPLRRAPVADELGTHLYLVADRANLFVLQRDPPACVAVEYLGHETGSIACAPARIGPYLIVPVNDGLEEGHWRVFVLEGDGARPRPAQRIPIPGWTWNTPSAAGAVVWSLTDRGGLTAFAIGAETESEPLRPIVRLGADPISTGPAFAQARNERELIVSSGRTGGYQLAPERGTLNPVWSVVDVLPARAPIQLAAGLAVLTHQAREGRGVSLWGAQPTDGTIAWQTILGAPWPAPPWPTGENASIEVLGPEGQALRLTPDVLKDGGFVEAALTAPGKSTALPAGVQRLASDQFEIAFTAQSPGQLQVRRKGAEWRKVVLPSDATAPAAFWGDALLVPGSGGVVFLIDPATGASKVEPYVPPFDRGKPTHWESALAIDAETALVVDQLGRLQRLSSTRDAHPRLVPREAAIELGAPLAAPPVATLSALVLVTTDGRIRALSTRDLSPIGAWPLSDALAVGPALVGDLVLVGDQSGQWVALDASGRLKWSVKVEGGGATGPPVRRGDRLLVLTRQGAIVVLSSADGSVVARHELDVLPSAGALPLGDALAVPAAPGTFRRFEVSAP